MLNSFEHIHRHKTKYKLWCLPVSRPSWEWRRSQLSRAVRKPSRVSAQLGISVLLTKMCRPRPFPKPSSSSELCINTQKAHLIKQHNSFTQDLCKKKFEGIEVCLCHCLFSPVSLFAFLLCVFHWSFIQIYIAVHWAQVLHQDPWPRTHTTNSFKTQTYN